MREITHTLDMSLDQRNEALTSEGWAVIPAVIDGTLIDELTAALIPSLARRDAIRQRNGVSENTDGTLHHLLMDAPCYLDLLSSLRKLDPVFSGFFASKYILNAYGGVVNEAGKRSYVQHVHRDLRFTSDSKRFMMNILVMLDDFTEENGATYVLSSSHGMHDKPEDDFFFQNAKRMTGSRGSVLLFDSRIWHAAGVNSTLRPRRALTLSLTSPFFKQQLDYPRLFGYENASSCDEWMRQVIGFNSRTPQSLEEFYVPVPRRFYQPNQD